MSNFLFHESYVINIPVFFYIEYAFKGDTVRDCIDRVCGIKCQCDYEF